MSTGTHRHVRTIAVIIPAHNEETTIERCLESVQVAAKRMYGRDVRVAVVVVCDACTDATGQRARRALPAPHCGTIAIDARNVGLARRVGFCWALERLDEIDHHELWLATTDADCAVPPTWLERQHTLAGRGWDALAGTVRVRDWREQPPHVARRFASLVARTATADGHPHVHGANLGMTAAAYLNAGGMPAAQCGEDHALWAAVRASGCRALSSAALTVTTSARRQARAPDGFASFLDKLTTDVQR